MSLVRFRPEAPYADLAHLVERNLAKVEVAGSSPVIRLKYKDHFRKKVVFVFHTDHEDEKTPASSRRELAHTKCAGFRAP